MRHPPFSGRRIADTRAVLVPTDLSPRGRVVIEYAAGIAAALHAELHIVYVDELRMPQPGTEPASVRADGAVQAPGEPSRRPNGGAGETDGTVEEALRRHAAELLVPVTLHHCVGASANVILEVIDAFGIDLVVMAASRRRGAHFHAESRVWTRVIRGAPCPVLVLPLDKRAGRVDLSEAFPPFSGESGL